MPSSTRFVVSLHTLALLAVSEGKPMRSEDLAVSANTNAVVVRSLLSRLASAGLTRSQMGHGGGALLAKPPESIRLLDVYMAVEDRDIFTFHRSPPDDRHAVGRYIVAALRGPLAEARRALEQRLAELTIRDIVDDIDRRHAEDAARLVTKRFGRRDHAP